MVWQRAGTALDRGGGEVVYFHPYCEHYVPFGQVELVL